MKKLISKYLLGGFLSKDEIIKLQTELVNKGYLVGENEIDGIIGPKTTSAYNKYLQDTSLKPKTKLMSFEDIKSYELNINNLDNETIINYYHLLNNTNKPYIVDDKINNKLRVYYNGKLIREYNAIHGKNSNSFGNTYKKKVKNNNIEYIVKEGDYLGKIAKENNTTIEELMEINNISNPNFIKIGLIIKLPGFSYIDSEVDPDEATVTYVDKQGKLKNLSGNLTTPAGIYFSSRAKKDYHGVPSFIRRTLNLVSSNLYEGIPSSIHSRTIKEGANTNGCTGLDSKDMIDLAKLLLGYDNIPTYILPANLKNKFAIRNGKLIFKSHDINKTPSHNEMDYSSIQNIKFKSDNLNDEQKNIIKRFSKSLINNKKLLLKDLGLNNDTYLQLSKYCLGILGVESNYGDQHSGLGNFLRASIKLINKNSSSPDYKSKYYTYGAKGDYNSVGLTQMRLGYLGEFEKELFKKYNISKKDLVDNPEKAAIATMIKIASEYKNQSQNYQKAVSSWNNRSNYFNRVNEASKRFNLLLNYNTFKFGGKLISKYQNGKNIYYISPQYGFSPTTSQTNVYQPIVTDVQRDIELRKPIGTTTAKREIKADQQKLQETIQAPVLSREVQDEVNKAAQTANVLQPLNTALDITEYFPIVGDAVSIGRAGSEAVSGNLLGAGLITGMTLLPGVTSKPVKEILPQIKPLIRGAEIEKQLSKQGTINRKQLDAYINKQGRYYQLIMNDVLSTEFNGIDRIDYTAFQDAVQKRLPVYSRVPQTDYRDYGLDRLGYSAYEFIDGFGNSLPNSNLRTFTFETPTIVGDNRHYNGSPIGHSRTYTTKDEPDILHVMESQSDWAQHPSRIPYFGGLHSPDITVEDYKEFVDSSERTLKEMEEHSSYFLKEDIERQRADVQSFKKILENLISGNKDLQLEHLQSHYTERQIQENLKYAAEHGQTKMRYPTRETAAKIEGYTKKAIPRPTREQELSLTYKLDRMWKEYFDSHEAELRNIPFSEMEQIGRENIPGYSKMRDELDALFSIPTEYDYSPKYKTILKKYADFPKQYQKLFGKNTEVRTVTDSKGNTWYEVDVPESYKNGTGQIIFAKGGKLIKR